MTVREVWRYSLGGGLALLLPSIAAAGLHFERISSPTGPPSRVITALARDRDGLIWIGTISGVSVYDGNGFTSWAHDPSDPASLSDDAVRSIYEDSRGTVWVGTHTGGLNGLNRSTGAFEHFRHDPRDPSSLSHDTVFAIVEDRSGSLWVGTRRGLNRLDRSTGRCERFLPELYVSSLLVDGDGRLWVGTAGGGILRWDPAAKTFERLRQGSESVWKLIEHPRGVLWAGTNDGLDRLDVERGSFTHFAHRPEGRAGLSFAVVWSLAAADAGKLWVGTFGGGLELFDPSTGAFRAYPQDPLETGSPAASRILSLLVDHEGGVWVATFGGGLLRVPSSAMLLAEGAEGFSPPASLADRDVTAMTSDRSGALWIGTRSGTLLRRDPVSTSYRRVDLGNPGRVLRLLGGESDVVWVGTDRGVFAVRAQGRVVNRIDLGAGAVSALLRSRDGALWAGTSEGGLQQLDDDGHVRRRFLEDDDVTTIHESAGGTLWVGTRTGGLEVFDPRTGRAVRYLPDPGDLRSIAHHNINAIYEDRKGRLWFGTAGGGLNHVEGDAASGRARFRRVTVADGLVDNNVMSILEDDDGSLWLGTKRGLSRYVPESGTFTNYLAADGLPSGEFEFRSAIRWRDRLIFGTVSWLAPIPAGTAVPQGRPSPTVLAAVQRRGDEALRAAPAHVPEKLAVPYGEWFTIDFAVLDFRPEYRHAYAYRLSKDAPWIELGARRSLTFTDLSPGRYSLTVRGRNARGAWSESRPLALEIVPPFWMTWWFRSLAFASLAASAFAVHRVRLARRERANRELADAYERLQSLTRRFEAAKEEERRYIARELHDDLGPNLTAVNINLRLLRAKLGDQETARRFEDTVEVVDRMVQQVRNLSLDLRPPLLDEMGLITALKGYLETQAERTGLIIDVEGDAVPRSLPPEIEIAAFRTTQEAVTNVIRHADATRVSVAIRCPDGVLEIDVEDDGRGFDAGRTVGSPASGKSVGVLGMFERARMLGGTCEIDSSPGRGTRVKIRIPVEAGR